MTTDQPRVWLGCLACYNNGDLVGIWLDLGDDYDPEHHTSEYVHQAAGHTHDDLYPHEEVWVMDSENVPLRGEFGVGAFESIHEAWERAEHQWPAYLAYAHSGLGSMDGDGVSDPSDFEDAFCGEWASFREYVEDEGAFDPFAQFTDVDPGPWADRGNYLPDDHPLRQHFNWASYAEEMEQEYTTAPAPGGGVFIFRDN